MRAVSLRDPEHGPVASPTAPGLGPVPSITARHPSAPPVGAAVATVGYAAYSYATRVPSSGKYPIGTLPADAYDVVIVGGEGDMLWRAWFSRDATRRGPLATPVNPPSPRSWAVGVYVRVLCGEGGGQGGAAR